MKNMEENDTTNSEVSFGSTIDAMIGQYAWMTNERFINGTLDEIAFYNIALNSTEISNHFIRGNESKNYCEMQQ